MRGVASRRGVCQQALSGDQGSAIVEFVLLGVALMIPLCYLLLAVSDLQRAAYAVTTAAREAGRAFVTAPDIDQAYARADAAARIALADQGMAEADSEVRVECAMDRACLEPGGVVWVSAKIGVALPLVPASSVTVQARHAEPVDPFRAARG
jgi:Flp pilus assembly protein TadG